MSSEHTHPLSATDKKIINSLITKDKPDDFDLINLARLINRYDEFPGEMELRKDIEKILSFWKITRDNLFLKTHACIKIQSLLRMYFSKIFVNSRGPALNKRELCNNNTDFVTLEPLKEIPIEQFFSYKDDNNFIYGFNLISLMKIMKKQKILKILTIGQYLIKI